MNQNKEVIVLLYGICIGILMGMALMAIVYHTKFN